MIEVHIYKQYVLPVFRQRLCGIVSAKRFPLTRKGGRKHKYFPAVF